MIFLSKTFRKKSIVVVGGYDIAYEKEISYGLFCSSKWLRILLTKYALKNADLVLAVSKHAKKESSRRAKTKDLKLLYNGIKINPKSVSNKKNVIVTIGQAKPKKSKLKGLNVFAKASIHFPGYKFVIIGDTDKKIVDRLKKINPNLVFTGKLPHKEVLNWLKKAKVYCQLSFVESFGMGLAEAMSYECIPVVTGRGALCEVVGDLGFIVDYGDIESTVKAIKNALNAPSNLNNKVRNRVVDHFSIQKREVALLKIFEAFLFQ